MRKRWGPARTAVLRNLAAAGVSGTEIARTMGVSRSAVLGRAWRCGIRLICKSGPKPGKRALAEPP